ncbi:MAG: hypothetical protein IKK84_03780 [Clostridia bacterium]|nr:hypothetical protein [Clostridia bacterium]
MKYKKERKEKKSFKELFKARFSGMTFKSYIKETYDFVKNNLLKTTLILLAIALLSIGSVLYSPASFKYDKPDVTFVSDWIERIQVLAIIVFAGVVPYMYIPVVGLAAGISTECMYFANYVLTVGRMKGTLVYILPMLLNLLFLAIATAIGFHICRNATLSQRIKSVQSKNSMDLGLAIFEATNKKDKVKAIEKKRKDKIKELESKKKDLDLFQIVNVTIIISVLQLVASYVKSLLV